MFDFFKKKGRKCPYCNVLIEKEPKGKFKCPSCKEEIHLQKLGDKTIFISKMDYESLQIDKKRKTEENKYYRFFENYDLSYDYLTERKNEWFNKFKEKANFPDLIWSLLNDTLTAYAKSQRFHDMAMLYLEMAVIQKNNNKEFFHLLQESKKMELYSIKKEMLGLKYKIVISATYNKYCQECQEQDGKMFTVDEALEKMPIPVKNCTNDGFCRCCYATKIDDR
jgi:rubrerythrin